MIELTEMMIIQMSLIIMITSVSVIGWNGYWFYKYINYLKELQYLVAKQDGIINIASKALRNADRSEYDSEFEYWIDKSNSLITESREISAIFDLVSKDIDICKDKILLPSKRKLEKTQA